ncbi:VanZ family protein [uncultured Clostridium sp.]|uniref:VanZ family protein n=1 Tax=uncultured Clostridium sp. TaxID=59620 RepID=UPI0025D92227|nr:VanZ family protein [uncultured Clostridium sp.]
MKKVISVVLCVLWMIFIFLNSSQSGTASNGLSYKIVDKIISIGQYFELNINTKVDSSFNNIEKGENNIIVKASKNINNNKSSEDAKNIKRVTLNKILRKIAHAVEYLILAVLLANMFFAFGLKGKSAIIYILFGVLFYAVLDEFHQLYVPSRDSQVVDILIDFGGGVIGNIVYYLGYYKLFKKK